MVVGVLGSIKRNGGYRLTVRAVVSLFVESEICSHAATPRRYDDISVRAGMKSWPGQENWQRGEGTRGFKQSKIQLVIFLLEKQPSAGFIFHLFTFLLHLLSVRLSSSLRDSKRDSCITSPHLRLFRPRVPLCTTFDASLQRLREQASVSEQLSIPLSRRSIRVRYLSKRQDGQGNASLPCQLRFREGGRGHSSLPSVLSPQPRLRHVANHPRDDNCANSKLSLRSPPSFSIATTRWCCRKSWPSKAARI